MKRKKRKPIFVRNCDYCGEELQTNEPNSDSYVITAEHKIFCKIHYVGQEPIKDCLEDYINDKRKNNVRKKEEKQKRQEEVSLLTQKKISVQERQKVIKKLDAYLAELNQKQRLKNATQT